MEIEIPLNGGPSTSGIVYQSGSPASGTAALILAHGAGAGQRHPFMVAFARGLSERGIDVLTFDFLYMHQRRSVPDRMSQLVACFEAAIGVAEKHLARAQDELFIGGKSMGGRAATHVMAASSFSRSSAIKGIVLLGYPLHPPGRPDQLRDAHLPDVELPMLFVQGTRDVFGTPKELAPVIERLTPRPALHVVEGGDHSFKIAGKDASKRQPLIYGKIQDAIGAWIASER